MIPVPSKIFYSVQFEIYRIKNVPFRFGTVFKTVTGPGWVCMPCKIYKYLTGECFFQGGQTFYVLRGECCWCCLSSTVLFCYDSDDSAKGPLRSAAQDKKKKGLQLRGHGHWKAEIFTGRSSSVVRCYYSQWCLSMPIIHHPPRSSVPSLAMIDTPIAMHAMCYVQDIALV